MLAIYLPSFGNLPVFDDEYLANGGLARDFAQYSWLRPRVLSYGTFVWVQSLLGDDWWKQRLVTLLMHAGTVAALWAFYREVLRHIVAPAEAPEDARRLEDSAALPLAIAFFALNPVAVYAVAYLVQRSIVMATLFSVLALFAFARGLRTRQAWLHGLAIASYALAVLSKEYAILLPLAAIPLYVVVARPATRQLVVGLCAIVALGAAAGIALGIRYGNILGAPFDEFSRIYLQQLAALDPNASQHAWALSIENEAWLFFEYGVRWMLPWNGWLSINLRPSFPVSFFSFPHLLGPLLFLAVLGASAWLLVRFRDWRALVGLSLAIPLLLFGTEFATVWVQDPFVLYRSYLWAIGIPGLVFCMVHGPSPRAVLGVGLVLGALLAWQAIDRVLSLDTPERAWTDAIAKLSKDPRAVGRWFPYLNRGASYAERDEWPLALRDFESSAALGDMGMGAFNTGSILSSQNKHVEALKYFDRSQGEGYMAFNLPLQRGLSLAALGRPAEAYANFDVARRMDPTSPSREFILLQQGRTALQLGKPDEAVPLLAELAQRDPKNREGRYLLGMALVTKKDYEKAREVLTRLLGEEASGPGFYARALANYGLQRRDDAQADIQQALRRDPNNAHLREWDAKIRAMPAKP